MLNIQIRLGQSRALLPARQGHVNPI
jgi:hypothetical protein